MTTTGEAVHRLVDELLKEWVTELSTYLDGLVPQQGASLETGSIWPEETTDETVPTWSPATDDALRALVGLGHSAEPTDAAQHQISFSAGGFASRE